MSIQEIANERYPEGSTANRIFQEGAKEVLSRVHHVFSYQYWRDCCRSWHHNTSDENLFIRTEVADLLRELEGGR